MVNFLLGVVTGGIVCVIVLFFVQRSLEDEQ